MKQFCTDIFFFFCGDQKKIVNYSQKKNEKNIQNLFAGYWILGTNHLGILFFINNFDIIKFDIQILINRMKGSSDLKIVFEFNSYPFAYKALEKGVKKLFFRFKTN